VIRAAVLASSDLAPDLGGTVLFRSNVERIPVAGPDEVHELADAGRLDVVVVDTDGAAAGVWSASPPPGDASLGPPAMEPAVGDATIVYRPPRAVGPLARLRVLEPTGGDRTILLEGGGLTIGRAPDNGLVLGDARASRHHAHLHLRQGTLVLVDLDSQNGTIVNGQRVTEVALGVGDQILIGDTRLLIEALVAA